MNTKAFSLIIAVVSAAALAFIAGRYSAGKPAAPGTQVQSASTGSGQGPSKKPLYYRNPMGLPDTSPVPKKDPMGMDYIPVYQGEDEADAATPPGTVKISAAKVQKLGVRTERVGRQALARNIRAVGTLQVDERGLYTVSPKFDGWIERLHVNTTGQAVAKGQPLMEVYSPELVSAQREYLIARNSSKAMDKATTEAQSGLHDLSEAALARLKNWDISEAQLRRLAQTGQASRTLTLVAPAGGIVLEKPSVAGRRFMAGEALFQIASIANVWLIAEVFEQDLGAIHPGQQASLRINAYPEQDFSGTVTFIYPTLTPESRTAKVRIELRNPDGKLKPGMFGTVELAVGKAEPVLTVPDSAVIDSGTRQVVLVSLGEGRFEPRAVKLGQRGDGLVEVREGLKDGDEIVVRANFLIDSESNLKAALGGLSDNAKPAAAAKRHEANGKVAAIDAASHSVTLAHGPVPSLKWPGMTMDFQVEDAALLQQLKPGNSLRFEFEDRGNGVYLLTRILPAGQAAAPHGGH